MKMKPEFSILVVCLNPAEKLKNTLDSIAKQTYQNYEVLVKDGLSTDGSLDWLKEKGEEISGTFPCIRLIEQKDSGIYDAMNQAAAQAQGKYLYFLNCGDYFYEDTVLEKMAKLIAKKPSASGIYYGNIFERITGQVVSSNPKLDAFGCYRNVPCHQACFYDKELLLTHPFDTRYRVRADYEQFLWCFFQGLSTGKTDFIYEEILVADYEGGGFSETRQNRKCSKKEHTEIVRKYMSVWQVWKYRLIMWVTLAPLRTWIASNPTTSGFYNRLKKIWYERGRVTK